LGFIRFETKVTVNDKLLFNDHFPCEATARNYIKLIVYDEELLFNQSFKIVHSSILQEIRNYILWKPAPSLFELDSEVQVFLFKSKCALRDDFFVELYRAIH
jgi:hypothetical protein